MHLSCTSCPGPLTRSFWSRDAAISLRSAPAMSGRGASGSRTMPGRPTNAARQPARSAPAMSQAWAATRHSCPTSVPSSWAAMRYASGGRLQPPRRIGRQHPLEEWRQASVIELRLDHRLRRICQRGKSEATLPQPLQGTADLRVRWQPLHRSEDHCCVRLGQLAPAPLGDHRQCRPPDRAEVCVLVGDSGDQRGLQQLLEPFAADRRVAEDLAERVIEGAEIKERFVDVEDEDDRTRCHRLQAYRSPTATAARPGCLAGRRPTRTRMGNRPREARARCPPARRTWHGPGKSRSIRSRRPAPAQPRLRT
jgi:hypothetical protein